MLPINLKSCLELRSWYNSYWLCQLWQALASHDCGWIVQLFWVDGMQSWPSVPELIDCWQNFRTGMDCTKIGGLFKDSWEYSGIVQLFCNPQDCKKLCQIWELTRNPAALCHDREKMLSINLQSFTDLRSRCNSSWMCRRGCASQFGGQSSIVWELRGSLELHQN